ncbi:MAG: hypothetical protein PHV07_09875 [Oscillospiraceae bacterium]|nr:hypothetical protein [Oscillospiraceae bacterium]
MKKLTFRAFYILNCIVALIFGFLIYIFLRKGTNFQVFFAYWDLSFHNFSNTTFLGSNFLKYYLVDGLWCYSFVFAASCIWPPKIKNLKLLFISGFTFGLLWEILQAFQVTSGTFDVLDLFMYLSASLLAVGIIYFRIKRENNEKNY